MGRHAAGASRRHARRTVPAAGGGWAHAATARAARTLLVAVGAATAAAVVTLPSASAAQREPVPVAKVRLPAAAEALSPYLPQVSCDPEPKPGVVAFRALMLSTYRTGRDGGIVSACSVPGLSEHKEGRAWDWMLIVHDSHQRRVADTVLGWLLAPGPHGEPAWNARRFGIMYIIWNRHIWGAYLASAGWRSYVGVSEHTDHIHFSFSWAGAMRATSWWTGKVAPVDYGRCAPAAGSPAPPYRTRNLRPCAVVAAAPGAPAATYAEPGDSGARVLAVQRRLDVHPLTGFYGPGTQDAVAAFQRRHGLARTGIADWMTAYRLGLVRAPDGVWSGPGQRGTRVLLIQRALRVRPLSGVYGAGTRAAVLAFQRRHGLRRTGVVDVVTAYRLGLAGRPRGVAPPAPAVWARPGQTGPRVLAVQRRLHVRPLSGYYGPLTAAAVLAFQRRHGLPRTGVVDVVTAHRLALT